MVWIGLVKRKTSEAQEEEVKGESNWDMVTRTATDEGVRTWNWVIFISLRWISIEHICIILHQNIWINISRLPLVLRLFVRATTVRTIRVYRISQYWAVLTMWIVQVVCAVPRLAFKNTQISSTCSTPRTHSTPPGECCTTSFKSASLSNNFGVKHTLEASKEYVKHTKKQNLFNYVLNIFLFSLAFWNSSCSTKSKFSFSFRKWTQKKHGEWEKHAFVRGKNFKIRTCFCYHITAHCMTCSFYLAYLHSQQDGICLC